MKQTISHTGNVVLIYRKAIIAFFIFTSFFTTFRLLTVGSEAANTAYEYAISALPEMFVAALCVYALGLWKKQDPLFLQNLLLYDWLVIGYMLFNVIAGVLLAGNLVLSAYAIRLTYVPMLFYFLARAGWSDKSETENTIKAIVKWYVIIGFIGYILYFIFPQASVYMARLSGVEVGEYFITRMGSLFWTPVVFSAFMNIGTLYCYDSLCRRKENILYLLFMIFWGCLFLSVSRGAIVTYVVGFLIITCWYRKWLVMLKCIICMVIVVMLMSTVIPLADLINFITSSTFDTFMLKKGLTRVEYWTRSYDDFIAYPWGHGLGKAGHVAARFFDRDDPTVSAYSTDGWYLKLVNETGFLGLLSYAILSITFFVQMIRNMREHKNSILVFLFIVFLVVGVQNIVSNVLDFYSFSCLYWLFIGFSQNIINKKTLHARS